MKFTCPPSQHSSLASSDVFAVYLCVLACCEVVNKLQAESCVSILFFYLSELAVSYLHYSNAALRITCNS